jgi:hypothetical protein
VIDGGIMVGMDIHHARDEPTGIDAQTYAGN